ncbi:MAG: DUF3365 domain-containing protein [Dokdonella sp.]
MKTLLAFVIATVAATATHAIAASADQPMPGTQATEWTPLQTPGDDRQDQLARADKAQKELATRLMKRLGESIAAGGPAAGIEVCANEAADITQSVAESNDVRIGRTSYKLRNPANSGPPWVAEVVRDRSTTRRYFSGSEGTLAVATPIPLGQMCRQCHGPVADISAEVKDALTRRYPQDMATGFEVGDVRGWFWVEVPAPAKTES